MFKGERKGKRSIRLNIAYRAIYTIKENGIIEFAYFWGMELVGCFVFSLFNSLTLGMNVKL